MKVELKRVFNCPTYCIGHLYVDGKYVCDTIEDTDRGLSQGMPLAEVIKRKVKHQTAIPTGSFPVVMNIVSNTFKKKNYYMKYCRGKMPRILSVPGFDGILIHRGNDQNSSSGCLIVGYNKVKGKVVESQAAFEKLYEILASAKDSISITITRTYKA